MFGTCCVLFVAGCSMSARSDMEYSAITEHRWHKAFVQLSSTGYPTRVHRGNYVCGNYSTAIPSV